MKTTNIIKCVNWFLDHMIPPTQTTLDVGDTPTKVTPKGKDLVGI